MATIVKYSTDRAARNNFPYEIISPPFPSRCCSRGMSRMGPLQDDGNERYYYRRCEICGFTVRELLSAFDWERGVALAVPASDRGWDWMERIRRQVSVEYAA